MKKAICILCLVMIAGVAYATDAQKLGQEIGELALSELTLKKNLESIHDKRIELWGRFQERAEASQEIEALKKEIAELKKKEVE